MMILLSVSFTYNKSIAQVESPCDCPSVTFIGATNTETNYSELTSTFQPGPCYFVSGTLVIDEDATFNNVKLIMGEKASIRVETGLQIFESYITGCGNMWQGIRLVESSSLGVFYSVIEDANIGIEMEAKTAIACQFTDFINNYIGISVGNPLVGDLSKEVVEQKDPILGCRFFTSGSLPDPFDGHPYDPAWPEHPTTPYNQGFAAIYISGVAMFSVGKEYATEEERNQIFNMRNGVIVRYSVADIFCTDLYDFEGGVSPTPHNPVVDVNQNGINSFGSIVRVANNTMDNLHAGIRSQWSLLNVYQNTISITPNIRMSRGITAHRPQALNIHDNVILEGRRGIEIIEVNNNTDIRDNILYRDLDLSVHVGISVDGQIFNAGQIGKIRNNIIEITDGHGAFGIHLTNTRGLHITDNDITYLIDFAQNQLNNGIVCVGTVGQVVARNTVNASPEYIDEANFGIASETGSTGNLFACNTISNFQRNFYFLGLNMATSLDRNTLNNADMGLFLQPPVFLGVQEHRHNKWSGSYGDFGAFIDDEFIDPTESAEMSQFIVDEQDYADFMPESIGPMIIEETWFEQANGDDQIACLSIPNNPVMNPDTLEKIILTDFGFEKYADEINWTLKSDVFELIHLNPDLKSNPVLDSFYNAESTLPLGQLIVWQNALTTTFDLQENNKLAKEDSILTYIVFVTYLDSLLALKPSDSLSLRALRTLKVDSLSVVFGRWLDLLEAESSATTSEYENILDDLETLTTSLSIEEGFRQALILQAQYKLGLGLSGSDSTTVLSLMDQCPLEVGRTIVTARELQSVYFDTIITTDMKWCQNESPFQIINYASGLNFNDNLLVAPNPFSNEISVRANELIHQISIHTLTGRQIFSRDAETRLITIPTDQWTSGVYYLSVTTDSGITHQQITCLR